MFSPTKKQINSFFCNRYINIIVEPIVLNRKFPGTKTQVTDTIVSLSFKLNITFTMSKGITLFKRNFKKYHHIKHKRYFITAVKIVVLIYNFILGML